MTAPERIRIYNRDFSAVHAGDDPACFPFSTEYVRADLASQSERIKALEGAHPLDNEDIALLIRLIDDNTAGGPRHVVESNKGIAQAMRLARGGYVALEQHALGVILHPTRAALMLVDRRRNGEPIARATLDGGSHDR